MVMYFSRFDRMIGHLNDIVNQCTSFKIGKTSNPEARHNSPDYRDKYPNIEVLYTSKSKELVSYVEAILIDECLSSVADRCDNEKDGEESLRDTMGASCEYYVYVVWR